MLLFIGWCGLVTALQWDVSDVKASIKWALPFLMYVLLRRMVRTDQSYLRYLRRLMYGFAIIVTVNATYIFQGKGLYSINWYTGFDRFKGVFKDLHSMAHTVGFAVMLVVLFFGVHAAWRGARSWRKERMMIALSAVIVPLALYSLVRGNVRTVMVGLVVFFGVLLWLRNRRWFAMFVVSLVAVWTLSSYWQEVFWDATRGKGVGTPIEMAGSGRPFIWEHNIRMYLDLPFTQQVMGLGVGNEIGVMPANGIITSEYRTRAWESHNDFLSALMELGAVGLLFVVYIYFLLFRSAYRIEGPERIYFMAMLAAVIVMNLLSNSYLNRFGLGQLFVMVMVGMDVSRHLQVSKSSAMVFTSRVVPDGVVNIGPGRRLP